MNSQQFLSSKAVCFTSRIAQCCVFKNELKDDTFSISAGTSDGGSNVWSRTRPSIIVSDDSSLSWHGQYIAVICGIHYCKLNKMAKKIFAIGQELADALEKASDPAEVLKTNNNASFSAAPRISRCRCIFYGVNSSIGLQEQENALQQLPKQIRREEQMDE